MCVINPTLETGLTYQVLYTVPVPQSQVKQIANISRVLGRRGGTVRLLVDHEAQIPLLLQISELSGYPPYVYIVIDAGDRHSGVKPGSPELQRIFQQIEQIVLKEGPITVGFVGFYCGANPNPNITNKAQALLLLQQQLEALVRSSPVDELRLSLPETLAATYISELRDRVLELPPAEAAAMDSLERTMKTVDTRNHRNEVRELKIWDMEK